MDAIMQYRAMKDDDHAFLPSSSVAYTQVEALTHVRIARKQREGLLTPAAVNMEQCWILTFRPQTQSEMLFIVQ